LAAFTALAVTACQAPSASSGQSGEQISGTPTVTAAPNVGGPTPTNPQGSGVPTSTVPTQPAPAVTSPANATGTPAASATSPNQPPGPFGLANTRATTQSSIDRHSVSRLVHAWTFSTKEPVSHAPLVANGVVYTADWAGNVYAIDAQTGQVRWQNAVETPESSWPYHGFAGTGALTSDGLLVEASVEGNAFALDQNTGKVVWKTAFKQQKWDGNVSTLLAHDGLVYVGLQSMDEWLSKPSSPNVSATFQGRVLALNTRDGSKAWETALVTPPENGVAVWSSFALDPAMGALFFGTGNNYTGSPSAHADSVMAVDAKSGKILWAQRVMPEDVWIPVKPIGPDYDFGAGPQLFDATINGQVRHLVGAGQKSGLYWAFDRSNGDQVWSAVIGYGSVGGGIRGEASYGNGRLFVWSNNNWSDGKILKPDQAPINVKALDPATGNFIWVQAKCQPAVSASGGFLANDVYFVGSIDGTINGYNAADGSVLWSGTMPNGSSVASSLVVAGDTLYAGGGVPSSFGGNANPSGLFAFRLGQGSQASGTPQPSASTTPIIIPATETVQANPSPSPTP
jgi:polyvinyl alcohol dehydrogenase (cytochrome)